jgi:hypothetical protein
VKTCETCQAKFEPARSFQTWCSPECAFKIARKKLKEKAEQKKLESQLDRKQRENLKKRSEWLSEAQAAVNAWVRYRDRDLPCVSCLRHHEGQWHAGHYLSSGARPELRFDESNIHKQCSACNTHLSGNLVLYRAELIRRIGLLEVERLEGPHTPRKYTADDLRAIREEYRARLREVQMGVGLVSSACNASRKRSKALR